MNIYYLYILFFILVILFMHLSIRKIKNNINDDGFILLKNILSNDDLNHINKLIVKNEIIEVKKYIMTNKNIVDRINKVLNDNYIFQDYIWFIKKSHVHTCHRDNNSIFFNKDQQYDSYTIIFYIEDMKECINIIIGSHKNRFSYSINLLDARSTILCSKGDAILFNAGIIHAGIINANNFARIQMKITHKNDLRVLEYYTDYNKVLDKKNNNSLISQHIQQHLSCQFPFFSDMTQKQNINSSKKDYKTSIFQKIYSYIFYSDPEFYNLKNVKS